MIVCHITDVENLKIVRLDHITCLILWDILSLVRKSYSFCIWEGMFWWLLFINNRLTIPFGNNTSLLPNVCCMPGTHALPSVTTAWAFIAPSVGAIIPPEVGELGSSARGELAWSRSRHHSMLPPVETFGEKNVQECCVMCGLTVWAPYPCLLSW